MCVCVCVCIYKIYISMCVCVCVCAYVRACVSVNVRLCVRTKSLPLTLASSATITMFRRILNPRKGKNCTFLDAYPFGYPYILFVFKFILKLFHLFVCALNS